MPDKGFFGFANRTLLLECFEIRKAVFTDEQGIRADLDRDGRDAECWHILIRYKQEAVATARVLRRGDTATIQRMAVLSQYRRKGFGAELMKHIIDHLCTKGYSQAVLSAQIEAVLFYQRHGFVPFGSEYVDVGRRHQQMRLLLE